jgi:hypothetical protein
MVDKYGIWDYAEAKKRLDNKEGWIFDKSLAEKIYDAYKPESVVDFGCGPGHYCKFLSSLGCIVEGYDGVTGFDIFPVNPINLAAPLVHIKKYELVLCLEVGEHIPKEYEDIFIKNLLDSMDKTLILSWAIPGQGGMGHVNEQRNEYVIEKLTKLGLKFLEKETMELRGSSTLTHFKNTILVFVK